MTFRATEFDRQTCLPTGRTETYYADDITQAVACLLHTRQLQNGSAHRGPTGRVVYSGARSYTLTPDPSSGQNPTK